MIEVTVDSGACDTVMPLSSCSSIPTVPSNQSKAGMSYEVAGGGKIPDLGEKRLDAHAWMPLSEDDYSPGRRCAQTVAECDSSSRRGL